MDRLDYLKELEEKYWDRWVNRILPSTEKVTTRRMQYDSVPKTNEEYYGVHLDYVRYREIELLSEELKRTGTGGSVAEVGVEFGYTSEILNRIFPESTLYLYDSFEGFDKEHIGLEENRFDLPEGYSEAWTSLRPTPDDAAELVKNRLPYPEKAVIRKGFFPGTALENDTDEKFKFVILDVDLYKTTLEGLLFFYPRLTTGGYIMVHDYNTDFFKGIHDAVNEAEETLGRLVRIPITDEGGSLVIQKL
ncbi:MAG: TylF/MycF/NovP-related O-methyltransferase [Eubacteriales bacterium]|nr:TylF/MycF/NovP-related O-methyltransferase [Eubacteriales bacterium]